MEIEFMINEGLICGPFTVYKREREIILYSIGDKRDEEEATLDTYCKKEGLEWCYADSVCVDYNQGVVYTDKDDIIELDGEYCGRQAFEEGIITLSEGLQEFINNSERALPSWIPNKSLEEEGYREDTREFSTGAKYFDKSINAEPYEVLAELKKEWDCIFRVKSYVPFDTIYTVWKKKK